ncbi:MAG: 5-methylthioadenosine/S-adenosylhomocysteine deaminase [Thermoleophilaceae bacterium]|nr:5-methylthioadenosine/S-adenosylhomocysteine deaminase [Thermoleophilaceae bacterium]
MNGDLLISGGEVLTADGRLEAADVLVRGGRIDAVGPGIEAEAPVLDAGGTIVAPGLINSHYHSNENFNPGLYEGLPLDLWFVHSHQVTRTEPMSAEAIYTRTMLGAVQMLRSGTTAVVDFVFEAPEITLETLEPVVRAYRDAGLRATVLLGVNDLHYLASLDIDPADRTAAAAESQPPSVETIMDVARGAVQQWHVPGGLVGIGLGPSAPQRCSDALLDATMALAREHGLVWQTHVQEARTQAVTARRRHGRSFVDVLGERGLLGPEATLVHAVWLDDRDRQLMAESGTSVAHCPYSNLRLGDGIANVPALLRAGVTVGIGTDGRGCDETLDMLEVTRLTGLLHKVHGLAPEDWLSAADAFAMATTAGSRCAGHGGQLGRVAAGARADLVLLRRDTPTFWPLNDPIRQLVFGATSRDVRTVIVDGRVVVEDGEVVGVDMAALLDDAARHAAAERDLVGAETGELESAVRRMFDAAEAAPHPVSAYVGR